MEGHVVERGNGQENSGISCTVAPAVSVSFKQGNLYIIYLPMRFGIKRNAFSLASASGEGELFFWGGFRVVPLLVVVTSLSSD